MDPLSLRLLLPVILMVSLFSNVALSQGLASKRCEFLNNLEAKCTQRFLISASLSGFPLGLQMLTLDRNQISSLENNVFWRTPLLQELSIAQNQLDTISVDAFADLKNLKKLNLSYNRLESFNEYLLDTISVEVLDLSGNNFMYGEGKLNLQSPTLRELYMRNSKLVSVNGLMSKLPSLQRVDLSQNLITTLDIPSFVPLSELQFVNLEGNFLRCDKPTQYLMDWFRKHDIKYEGPFCAIQRQDMFQRIEMSLDKLNETDIRENELLKNASLAKINVTHIETELAMSLFNKTYFKRCLLMDHEFVCHLLENCKESMNCEKYLEQQQKQNQMGLFFHLVIFIIGIFIGCVLALCCCQLEAFCRIDKERARRERARRQGRDSYHNVQLRPMSERQRGRGGGHTLATGAARDERETMLDDRSSAGALVESNGFHDFVNELFSRRRSRRQMISAIGQQGTNLVRQLSRSSLNLLRRSQSRAANASARAAGLTPSTPTAPPNYEPVDYTPIPSMRERSQSFTYSPEMINSNNHNLIEDILREQNRSESPPPTYDLCVRLPKDGHESA